MKTIKSPLSERWTLLQKENPNLRIRDAASQLGVSEAELLASKINSGVTRLEGDWTELIKSLPKLGRIMCLTRNEAIDSTWGRFSSPDHSK